ncbi:regulator of purine biosynthesis [Gracilibacillus halophilus YIM-C55.5]|uniref:Regulator of purine biosynthesis n=1 Tax=Gracilibacillus halophilus YIM-C55.5 TaxID=1308866 RepID=N4WTS4_9BACI|nr:RidA family protein [Gracilibacillus halophilus]ENH97760.1 regulator of purine biosynthesis [Gracilibacillus halophilus YIM-C55.5]
MTKAIHTDNAPQAIGPYSQAIDAGDFVYISGQIPLDPESMQIVEGDIVAQTNQVMANLEAILTEAGLTFGHVVKFTIYIANMDDFATINEAYAKFLQEPYPARATVEVSKLPKGAQVEMDAIVKK